MERQREREGMFSASVCGCTAGDLTWWMPSGRFSCASHLCYVFSFPLYPACSLIFFCFFCFCCSTRLPVMKTNRTHALSGNGKKKKTSSFRRGKKETLIWCTKVFLFALCRNFHKAAIKKRLSPGVLCAHYMYVYIYFFVFLRLRVFSHAHSFITHTHLRLIIHWAGH